MHVEVVNYLVGMETGTTVIANVDMLSAYIYDSSCDVTICILIVAIDWE